MLLPFRPLDFAPFVDLKKWIFRWLRMRLSLCSDKESVWGPKQVSCAFSRKNNRCKSLIFDSWIFPFLKQHQICCKSLIKRTLRLKVLLVFNRISPCCLGRNHWFAGCIFPWSDLWAFGHGLVEIACRSHQEPPQTILHRRHCFGVFVSNQSIKK